MMLAILLLVFDLIFLSHCTLSAILAGNHKPHVVSSAKTEKESAIIPFVAFVSVALQLYIVYPYIIGS